MASLRPLASRRRVVAGYLALTLLPSALLIGLAAYLIAKDRENLSNQIRGQRETAADLMVATLTDALRDTGNSLIKDAGRVLPAGTKDAVVIAIANGRVDVIAGGPIAYSPTPELFPEPPPATFAEAEAEVLATSTDPAVRVGALLWLARQQPLDRALTTYAAIGSIKNVTAFGVPADLLAQYARCQRLEAAGRLDDLEKEARSLRNDLLNARWSPRLTQTAYAANLADTAKWLGENVVVAPTDAERLAAAVDREWRMSGTSSPDWQRQDGDDGATVVRASNGARRIVLVALPTYVDRVWIAAVSSRAAQNGVEVSRQVAPIAIDVHATRRASGDTGLPWSIVASDADRGSEASQLATRRLFWTAGIATLVLLLGITAYLVTRGISRELAAARLQTDFVNAVSHEFRTPLTSMRQLTEVLADDRVTTEDRRRAYYGALGRQTQRLQRLVESLLDFGRMEAGATPYRLEPLDACALVRTVVETFEQDPAGRNSHVELDLDDETATVSADRDALTNALWNLLDNAVKYSPDNRTVWVSVHRESARLLIRVRDAGLGIPAAEQRVIFDKFVRGDRARAEGIKGTGIGLSMVRHIVRAHGGDVLVESQPGSGSTFTIQLPMGA